MFARQVTLKLKPNVRPDLTQLVEKEVLPMLRKQKGFKDELMFVLPDGKEALGISLWDTKENAELYSRDVYPTLVKMFDKLVEGAPVVNLYEVSTSTLHKLGVPATA